MSQRNVIRQLRTVLAFERTTLTDGDLLSRFAEYRDEAAFELLVWRHAGMVLRVCRGIIGDAHEAEDAAQATFLALARQAGTVGKAGSAAGWLFRVSRRIATRAARDRRTEIPATGIDLRLLPAPSPECRADQDRILHEELAVLSEKYRLPILLCFFEGLTHTEAALRLGWPVGTVAGRVSRGKQLLAARLARRGVVTVAAAATMVTTPASFACETARSAIGFVERIANAAPGRVLSLANWEVRSMIVTSLSRWACVAVVAGSGLVLGGMASPKATPIADNPPMAPPPQAARPLKAVIGKTFAIAPVTTDLQRLLIRGATPSSSVLVIVDGSSLFKNPEAIDLDAFEFDAMRKGLAAFPRDNGRAVIHFQVQYFQSRPSFNGEGLVDLAMAGFGNKEGFTITRNPGENTWQGGGGPLTEHVAALKDEVGSEAKEDGVGDERVRAYAVKTPLSRVLTASAGGVIDIRVPLTADKDDWVPPGDVEKSVLAAIAALKLEKGMKINFRCNIRGTDGHWRTRTEKVFERWAKECCVEFGWMSFR